MSDVSTDSRSLGSDDEHAVTPLELFFDLVFVFALTQITRLITDNPTWAGVGQGMLVLAALWWAWSGYAWLTSTNDVDEGGVRLAMLASMATMLVVSLAVPGAFGDDGILFGVAFLVVRLLHLVLYAIVGRGDPDLTRALLRVAPSELLAGSLLVAAGFVHGPARAALWLLAIGIDYLGPLVVSLRGWHIAPQHFAERHGLVILIALGESVIAIGGGISTALDAGTITAATLGIATVSALWWLYFDVAAIFARRRLTQLTGERRTGLALHAYSYLHLPMVAGIVVFAFGLETSLHHLHDPLPTLPAAALLGGVALYLLAHVAFLFTAIHRIFRRRTAAAVVLAALTPLAGTIPAITAVALVTAVCAALVAYEAIARRDYRQQLRHPDAAP